jgi:hypothetical protein
MYFAVCSSRKGCLCVSFAQVSEQYQSRKQPVLVASTPSTKDKHTEYQRQVLPAGKAFIAKKATLYDSWVPDFHVLGHIYTSEL